MSNKLGDDEMELTQKKNFIDKNAPSEDEVQSTTLPILGLADSVLEIKTEAKHSSAMAEKEVFADWLGLIQVKSDGSFIRRFDLVLNYPLCQQPWKDDRGVIVKDVADPESLYRLRLYLSKSHLHTETAKLPVIMYYHGGGFRASLLADGLGFHRLCVKWAATVGAIVVAVNYRVSPENPLPVAYDDSMAALQLLRIQMMRSP